MKSNWTPMHTIGLLVVLLLVAVVAGATPAVRAGGKAPWTWYGVLVLLAAFIVIAGQGVTGKVAGFMIDSRNKMTLSRLQLILWTVVILSAYLTVVLARVKTLGGGALEVAMPQELWWLLGISTASMVGSPLILSGKKQQAPNENEARNTVTAMAAQEGGDPHAAAASKGNLGTVLVNRSPGDARVADLFRGDETGNGSNLDLGKVQMLFFTVVLVLAYFYTLRGSFPALLSSGPVEFPVLPESMVALLGISHAGYLTHKAVPQSAPPEAPVESHDPPPSA